MKTQDDKIKQEVLKELGFKDNEMKLVEYTFLPLAIDFAIQKTTDYLMSSEANRVCYDGVMKLERAKAIREVFAYMDKNHLWNKICCRDILTPYQKGRIKKLKKKFGVDEK